MTVTEIEVSKVVLNKDNPRVIKDDKFKRLVESVKNFPEMLKIRPIVLNRDFVIIGGNQRFKACVEAGFKKVPFYFADELTPEQEKEFMIRDNVQSGEWDIDLLEGFEMESLKDWGLDFGNDLAEQEEAYSRNVEAPLYLVTGEKPKISELYDYSKTKEILERIEKSNVSLDLKEFLKIAAMRFTVLNFEKIAEFSAQEEKEVQELIEDNALVIIDFNRAIDKGFIQLTESIAKQYYEENGE